MLGPAQFFLRGCGRWEKCMRGVELKGYYFFECFYFLSQIMQCECGENMAENG